MSKKKKKINVALFRKVAKHILAEPKRVDMHKFILRDDQGDYAEKGFPKCGTVGCIAGWAVTLSTKAYVPNSQIEVRAITLLNLNSDQARRLFYTDSWPEHLKARLDEASPQTKKYAKLVAERIAEFIEVEA